MAKSKLVKANKKVEEAVVSGYQKIEHGVVGGYKKIEHGVVEGFEKITDKFVDNFLTKDGETVEEAKKRIAQEQKVREEKLHQDMVARTKAQEELVKKNLEVSLNTGKRVENVLHR